MIRRDVLQKPSQIEKLDVFNDAKDTAGWLRMMATKASDSQAALLMRTMADRLDERRRELARDLGRLG